MKKTALSFSLIAAALALSVTGVHAGGSYYKPQPKSVVTQKTYKAVNPCGTGYKWDAQQMRCWESHEPKFVENDSGCKLGELREVPDKNNPRITRIQACGVSGIAPK